MTASRLIVLVCVLIMCWFLSHQAGRLDRLHHRVETTRAALDTHLARRAEICIDISHCAGLDQTISAMMAKAARGSLAGTDQGLDDRANAENILSQALHVAFDSTGDVRKYREDAVLKGLLNELVAESKRVQLSRRFHAEAVGACKHVRRQRLVRLFHLAGHAALPGTFDFMDELPDPLA